MRAEYLETIPTMAEDRRPTAIRLPAELRLKLGYLALERKRSMNDFIVEGMIDWYNRQPEAQRLGEIDTALGAPTRRGPKKDDGEDEEG